MQYIPQQNGVAERKNRTIVEVARAMLEEKHMPKFLGRNCPHNVLLVEPSPTKGVHITLHEAYFGPKPNMAHLQVFGSIR